MIARALIALVVAWTIAAMPWRIARADHEVPAVVTTDLSPSTATVGDRLTLTIVVDHDQATNIEPPGFGADFGGLELIDVATPRDEDGDGRLARTTLQYTLVSFRTGEITVPPLQIVTRGPTGVTVLRSAARSVSVASVLSPGDDQLRPLKPQLEIREAAPTPAVPVLFAGAFAALTAFGYALHRRAVRTRLATVRAAPLAAPPSPHVVALARLDAVAARVRLIDGDAAEYYAGIAATVRAYLSERFGFAAYAMTRRELERAMVAHGMDRWPARLTANLLEQCDAAEYAGFVPASERREADLAAAYEIVTVTSEGLSNGRA